MFTGIIECLGTVKESKANGTNTDYVISSPISSQLQIDQSVAHDGVCLTVTAVEGNIHRVTAVQETLSITNLGSWKPGTSINLERAMRVDARLDGHFVQGHVDTTARCIERVNRHGSYEFEFEYDSSFAALLIPKGSVCINGVSLTVVNPTSNRLSVAIIPYTFKHTTFQFLQPGDLVNIEFDVLGKYIHRYVSLHTK